MAGLSVFSYYRTLADSQSSSQSSSMFCTRSKVWLAWVAELIVLCGHKRLFSNIFPLLLSSITTHNPITERLSIDKY
eukprot:scaffold13897_cov36-Cyclotella_meneghiniana.AAC.3